MTHPLAALLAGVPRYGTDPDNCEGFIPAPDGPWLDRDEVLAALSAAPAGVDMEHLELLRGALLTGRDYVEQWVKNDGGIDHCDIEFRNDLERIDAALALLTVEARIMAALTPAPVDEVRRAAEPDNFDQLVADGIAEAMKAMRKFPQPNYVISKIAEEAGEVVKAAIHAAEGRETAENLRGEMKQLIAMLYRLWVEGDGVHGLGSVSLALIEKDTK